RSETSCRNCTSTSSPAPKAIRAGPVRCGGTASASPIAARTSTGLSPASRHPFPDRTTVFMTFSLFGAPEREPSQFVGFAGNRIDRQSENRTDDALQLALDDPRVRIMQTRGGRLY